MEAAVQAALVGYMINRSISARERGAYLQKAADLIDVHHNEIRDILIVENGKSHYWADFEIDKMAEIIRTLADRSKDPQGTTYPMDAMKDEHTQHTCISLSKWNHRHRYDLCPHYRGN